MDVTREELERAGFREDCQECEEAVHRGREACATHYRPTHLRGGSAVCPTCGGGKRRSAEVCGRCRGARL